MTNIRQVAEKQIAIALVIELAETRPSNFSLLGFYDHDDDFLSAMADRIGVQRDAAFLRKITRVVRRLERSGVLYGTMARTHKEYVGEPAKQKTFRFSSPGKAHLLTAGEGEGRGTPEWEAAWLIRRAYPEDIQS